KRHVIYAGSSVLEVIPGQAAPGAAVALVVATGSSTRKGGLLQVMFEARPSVSSFEKAKTWTILLQLFSAIFIGVFFFLLNLGTAYARNFDTLQFILMQAAFLRLSSPVGATGMLQAARMAAARLRAGRFRVRTMAQSKLVDASQLRVMLFDKTGTLTEEEQVFHGVLPVVSHEGAMELEQTVLPSVADSPALLQLAVATCNTAAKINGGTELAGNSIECELLRVAREQLGTDFREQGQAMLEHRYVETNERFATVLKRFEFDQKLQLQSVLVQGAHEKIYVLTKGSPVRVMRRCDPKKLPEDFEARAQALSKAGFYVLAVAARELSSSDPSLASDNVDRDALERDLGLVGLLTFRNELKRDTRGVVTQFRDASILPQMVTGDNIYAGGAIAAKTMITLVDAQTAHGEAPYCPGVCARTHENVRVRFLLTQDAFRFLRRTNVSALRKILPRTAVLGSMTPDGKSEAVLFWQRAFGGYTVGMCGDGGNDSAALRISDMGVALSNRAEDGDSTADVPRNHEITYLAPFAADTSSLRACIHVLKEARVVAENGLAIFQFVLLFGFSFNFLRQYLQNQSSWFSESFGFIMDLVSTMVAVAVLADGRPREDAK
ncbi:unnamed protein product, partial [Amoebophrya sp. A25]